MINYKCIDQQTFSNGEYKLIPIRFEDRYDIMKWRNEQMYHLRQTTLLTIEQQDEYFSNVIAPLFDKDHPEQLLFSFFKKDELIGYEVFLITSSIILFPNPIPRYASSIK